MTTTKRNLTADRVMELWHAGVLTFTQVRDELLGREAMVESFGTYLTGKVVGVELNPGGEGTGWRLCVANGRSFEVFRKWDEVAL